MDASTSNGGGAERKDDNSASKDADSATAEFSPGFKDVDAFVKVCGCLSVLLCCFKPC